MALERVAGGPGRGRARGARAPPGLALLTRMMEEVRREGTLWGPGLGMLLL